MALEKFLDLITNERIWLVRASLLSDQRELSLPLDRLESGYEKHLSVADYDGEKHLGAYNELLAMRKRVAELKDRVYLSCWSVAQYESYALWKIYLGGAKAGVAIKSSVAALQKSLKKVDGRSAYVSKVDYLSDDMELPTGNLSDHFFINSKSSHYDYEREVRLYFLDKPELHDRANLSLMPFGSAQHMKIGLDPSILINEIYLSPFVIGGFRRTIEDVIRKVNPRITAKIRNSAVRDS